MEQTNEKTERVASDRLILGIGVMLFGILMFFSVTGFWHPGKIWPLFLILLGLAGEVKALRNRRGDGSIALLGVGSWMLAGTNHWFGLSVGNAMPIGVVVVGLLLVLHAFVDMPRGKEQER